MGNDKKLMRLILVTFSVFIISMISYTPIYAEYQGDVRTIRAWLSDYVIRELDNNKTYKTIDEFIDAVCDISIADGLKEKEEVQPYRESAKVYFKYKAKEDGISTTDILEKINNGYGENFTIIMWDIESNYLDSYTQWIANDEETVAGPINNTIVNDIKEVKYKSIGMLSH